MPPLVDARAKIDRARLHIADLDSQKTNFLEAKPYDVTPEYYADKDMTVYSLGRFTPVPTALPLIIGDAVHTLIREQLGWQDAELPDILFENV